MKAFPTSNWQKIPPISNGYDEGMDLRDYFAAKAMTGMIGVLPTTVKDADLAVAAYLIADAMIKARNGEENDNV